MATAPARRGGLDVTAVFTWYLVFLFAIPATAVVGALGTVGSPATIFSLVALVWYLLYQINRTRPLTGGGSPVRRAMLAFMLVMVLVYAHAMTTFIPPSERTNADSSLIRIIGTAGIVLVLCDGLRDRARLRTMLGRITIGVTCLAILAIAQFATGQAFVDRIAIPGLTLPSTDGAIGSRGEFVRPAGTATNAIEFGAVIAMGMPIALTLAVTSRRRKLVAWLPVALIGITVLFSLSRTTIICVALAMLVLFPGWNRKVRMGILAAAPVGILAAGVAVPGLLGTLRGMFLGAGDDTSVQSRTDAYAVAGSYINRHLWLGRGYNTFLPQYWILDNAYLQMLIGGGLVGLVALLALMGSGIVSAFQAMHTFVDDDDKLIARALMASATAGAVSLFFFDALSFPQSAGMVTMVIGLCGAALRIARTDRDEPAVAAVQELPAAPAGTGSSAVQPA